MPTKAQRAAKAKKRAAQKRAAARIRARWVAPSTKSALSLPEILEAIFLHLDRDLFTLQQVCHLWNNLVRTSPRIGLYVAVQTDIVMKPEPGGIQSQELEIDPISLLMKCRRDLVLHPALQTRTHAPRFDYWCNHPYLDFMHLDVQHLWIVHNIDRQYPGELSLTATVYCEDRVPMPDGKYFWEQTGPWQNLLLTRPGLQALRLLCVKCHWPLEREDILWRRNIEGKRVHEGVDPFNAKGLTMGDLFESIKAFTHDEQNGFVPFHVWLQGWTPGSSYSWHFLWEVQG